VSTATIIKRKKKRKYCKSCWREESHVRVRFHPVVEIAMVVLTLGLVFLCWPYRCRLCGKLRPCQDILPKRLGR
jgi:hypothetical protein